MGLVTQASALDACPKCGSMEVPYPLSTSDNCGDPRQFEEAEQEGSGCKGTLCCHFLKDASMTQYRIRVRVGGCTAYTSVVDMKPGDPIGAWNYGIELQWVPPN
ncbi:hypothetical protein GH714_005888 [Hevea brasiliensis]|uniref:Uncharacterized protein n=2 Tax=Hevea brasiliensis TaxID=3981 RepID=A0A6A6KHB7_HEVBR|nr:hypothetical protein GH714_005884 [Hevea brasiliensis]KAF2288303.1 hypothetical protein GH714_005888 [Hevea brasiliensis]